MRYEAVLILPPGATPQTKPLSREVASLTIAFESRILWSLEDDSTFALDNKLPQYGMLDGSSQPS